MVFQGKEESKTYPAEIVEIVESPRVHYGLRIYRGMPIRLEYRWIVEDLLGSYVCSFRRVEEVKNRGKSGGKIEVKSEVNEVKSENMVLPEAEVVAEESNGEKTKEVPGGSIPPPLDRSPTPESEDGFIKC